MSIMPRNGEVAQMAMLDGFKVILKARLTKQFEEAAKPIIEAAVAEALAGLKVGVEAWYSPMNMQQTVELILTDKRTNK
jgi:hypothetical protein